MKAAILALFLVCAAEAAVKCLQGDGSGEAADCDDGDATMCYFPKFVEFTGFVDAEPAVQYGCGGCGGQNASACNECEGNEEDACNKAVELGEDFKCYSYIFNEDASAFEQSAEANACKRLAATTVKCNSPAVGAAAAVDYSSSGCGDCAADDDKCVGCDVDSCNSAATITAVLLPLLAALYACM